ncbi:HNH endonuclease [Undibacterium sp. Ji42W]|uniref:HNH endonuclease n=1 Tax=Undibacterium sp. Ji42W TaxID=3413039 RepID=UPI003BF3661C
MRPTSDQQIEFLQQLQRLFDEGDFSSTYKYALILALAELSVELGDDSGSPLPISMYQLAEKFAEFYWPQTVPYVTTPPNTPGVLLQNLGVQASVVNLLLILRENGATTIHQARSHVMWPSIIKEIASVVRNMPVRFLQNLPGGTLAFLYDPEIKNRALILHPGVAFNLRRFQTFVQQLVRAGWTDHVKGNKRNKPIIGDFADLNAFMFGTSRANLASVAEILKPIQEHKCFFCTKPLSSAVAVDHFIPWSRYPRDTALNFVVAHGSCNNDKRELLAARLHLERWSERNLKSGDYILESMRTLPFDCNVSTSKTIAKWAYEQGLMAGANAWISNGNIEKIQSDYLSVFD